MQHSFITRSIIDTMILTTTNIRHQPSITKNLQLTSVSVNSFITTKRQNNSLKIINITGVRREGCVYIAHIQHSTHVGCHSNKDVLLHSHWEHSIPTVIHMLTYDVHSAPKVKTLSISYTFQEKKISKINTILIRQYSIPLHDTLPDTKTTVCK